MVNHYEPFFLIGDRYEQTQLNLMVNYKLFMDKMQVVYQELDLPLA